MNAANTDGHVHGSPIALPALTLGLGTAVVMWCVWFITHLPALGLPSAVLGPLLLVVVLAGGFVAGRNTTRTGTQLGVLVGLVCGLVNLLLLGSKITEIPTDATTNTPLPGWDGLRPSAALTVAGFLATCSVLGAIGGLIGRTTSVNPSDVSPKRWLGRLAAVAAASYIPLILIGGLVTSTASGMAVPDWPGSYGANMFLYPIGLMSHPRIFLEHSHRLFGAMVGLTTLCAALSIRLTGASKASRWSTIIITVLTAVGSLALISRKDPALLNIGFAIAIGGILIVAMLVPVMEPKGERKHRIWAMLLLALVVAQGFLGGSRVLGNSPYMGVLHGVLAQLLFAMAVALAAGLSAPAAAAVPLLPDKRDRRAKMFATGLLHAGILQLVFGAMYRHLRDAGINAASHAMWSHVAFSFIVLTMAAGAGFMLASRSRQDGLDIPLRRLGKGIIACVSVQFILGWVTWVMVLHAGSRGAPPTHEVMDTVAAIPAHEVLIRTTHQANGALLLGLAAGTLVLLRVLCRGKQPAPTTPAGQS